MSSVATIVTAGSVVGGIVSSSGQKKAAKTQQEGALEQTRLTNEMNERLFHEARGSEGHALLPEYFGGFEAEIGNNLTDIYRSTRSQPTAEDVFANVAGLNEEYERAIARETQPALERVFAETPGLEQEYQAARSREKKKRSREQWLDAHVADHPDDPVARLYSEARASAQRGPRSREEWLRAHLAAHPDSEAADYLHTWDPNPLGTQAYESLTPSFEAGNRLIGDVFEGTVADERLKRATALTDADRAGSGAIITADRTGSQGIISADQQGSEGIIGAQRTGSQGILSADRAATGQVLTADRTGTGEVLTADRTGTGEVLAADRSGTTGIVNAQRAGIQQGLGQQLAALKARRNAGGLSGGSSLATNAALGATIPAYQQMAGVAAEQNRRLALNEATEGRRLNVDEATEGRRLNMDEATQGRRMDLNEATESSRLGQLEAQEAGRLGMLRATEADRLGQLEATEGRRLDMGEAAEQQRLYDQNLQLQFGMLDAPMRRAQAGYTFGQMEDEARYQDFDSLLKRLGYANIGPGNPMPAQTAPTYAIPNDQMMWGSALSSAADGFGSLYASGVFDKKTTTTNPGMSYAMPTADQTSIYQPSAINWGFGG